MSFSRIIKNLIGLIFIPLVSGAALSLFDTAEDFFRVNKNSLYLPAGIALYVLVRIIISRLGSSLMEFFEVFYHELIHTFYSIISFKGVKSFFASDTKGGEIEISKSNFVIELSPYFFPLFALIFCGLKLFIEKEFQCYMIFLAGLGTGLHLSSLFHDFKFEQSDIEKNGALFSFVIVLLLNIIFFGIILSILGSDHLSIWQFFERCINNSKNLVEYLTRILLDVSGIKK